jgi:Tat protein translocase TatB subunit
MFEFGFSELILVVLVALVVLSPRDFARISRTLGEWVAKGRRYWRELSAQVKQENALKDVKAFREEITQQVRYISSELASEEQQIKRELAPDLDVSTTIVGLNSGADVPGNIQKSVLTSQTLEKARAIDPFANPYNLPPTYDELVEQVRCLHQRLCELESPKQEKLNRATVAPSKTKAVEVKHVES